MARVIPPRVRLGSVSVDVDIDLDDVMQQLSDKDLRGLCEARGIIPAQSSHLVAHLTAADIEDIQSRLTCRDLEGALLALESALPRPLRVFTTAFVAAQRGFYDHPR